MKADPEVRAWLERAARQIPVDTERALANVLAARQRPTRKLVAFAIAATLIVVGAAVVWERSADQRRFVQASDEPFGRVALMRHTEGEGTLLLAMDVETGERTPLTVAGTVTWAEWSPDGAAIAYTLEEGGGTRYALVVANADGSEPVRLVEQEKEDMTLKGPNFVDVSWSPDGTQLAFSGRTIYRGRTVSVVNADGTGERVLDGFWTAVSWSPDGEQLLLLGWPYDVGRDDIFDLYTMRPDGTDLVRLTADKFAEFQADWSPDGSQIVYTKGDSEAENANADIYVMDADGSNVRQLTDLPSFEGVGSWSPDGRWIVFASDRDTPVGHRVADLGLEGVSVWTSVYVMRADGSDVRRLLEGTGSVHAPVSWTR